MAGDLLDSLSAFLRALADRPSPHTISEILVETFHDSLDVRASAVLAARPPLMIVFSLSGFPSEQAADFESLPLGGDYPGTRAFHEAELVIDPVIELPARYAAMASPTSRGRAMVEWFPQAQLVSAPIIGGGRTVGAYTAVCDSPREWSTLDLAVLSTISHALGMWLTHPDSGLPDEYSTVSPALTPRQVEILGRLGSGLTNAAIAADLHCSESTVKAEIGRILRSLDVDTREAAAERARAAGLIDGSPR